MRHGKKEKKRKEKRRERVTKPDIDITSRESFIV